jgi:hypothetical protein
MAERLLLVCDTCGQPAAETVTFRTSHGNRQRDYCTKHLQELLAGGRVPKRGRRPGSGSKRTTRKIAASKRSTARKKTVKKTVARRRASPGMRSGRKAAATSRTR